MPFSESPNFISTIDVIGTQEYFKIWTIHLMIFPPLNTYYLSVLGQILTCKARPKALKEDRVVEVAGQDGLKVIEVLEVLEVDEVLGVLL